MGNCKLVLLAALVALVGSAQQPSPPSAPRSPEPGPCNPPRKGCILSELPATQESGGPRTPTSEKAAPGRTHPGRIVDYDKQVVGIEGVAATAYGDKERVDKGTEECPTFKGLLNADRSDKDGRFRFTVDRSAYVATYCGPGYHSRTVPVNKSESDGAPVEPLPIRLMPVSSDVGAYRRHVARELAAFLGEMRYLREARPEQFREALTVGAEQTDLGPLFAHELERAVTLPERIK